MPGFVIGSSLSFVGEAEIGATDAGGTTITPASGDLVFSGSAPTVTVSDNRVITPASGDLVFSGSAPVVTVSGGVTITPASGDLVFTGSAPIVTVAARAVVTLCTEKGDTTDTSTYASDSFTPAANDLLIALAAVQDTVDAGDYTSSDAGKTYTKLTSAVWTTSTDTAYAFVADQLADADSQTGTMDVTGDAGGGCAQVILCVSGMSKAGLAAVRQFKILDNQAAGGTPSITFDAACLIGNPTIFIVAKNGTGAVTEPSGWTARSNINFSTPSTCLHVSSRDSGFTGTTITAGGTSGSAYCVIGIELDSSASFEISPTAGQLVFSGSAPTVTVSDNRTITPASGDLVFSGSAPVVTASDNRTITPASGDLVFSGAAPTITVSDNHTITPDAGQLVLSGTAPILTLTDNRLITPASGDLVFTGSAPTVTVTGDVAIAVLTRNLVIGMGAMPKQKNHPHPLLSRITG
jgi:hypothetical protein